MIRRIAPLLGALILMAVAPADVEAQADPSDLSRTLERFVRVQGFSAVKQQISRDGTLLGLSPSALVGPLAAAGNGLTPPERETLLLVLLIEQTDDEPRARVSAELARRSVGFDDWTLLALIVEEAAHAGVLDFSVLAELADRVLVALSTPGDAAYERLAHSLASTAADPRLLARTMARDEETIASAGILALAETFRSIARLSRSRVVVEASSRAARRLIAVSSRG